MHITSKVDFDLACSKAERFNAVINFMFERILNLTANHAAISLNIQLFVEPHIRSLFIGDVVTKVYIVSSIMQALPIDYHNQVISAVSEQYPGALDYCIKVATKATPLALDIEELTNNDDDLPF